MPRAVRHSSPAPRPARPAQVQSAGAKGDRGRMTDPRVSPRVGHSAFALQADPTATARTTSCHTMPPGDRPAARGRGQYVQCQQGAGPAGDRSRCAHTPHSTRNCRLAGRPAPRKAHLALRGPEGAGPRNHAGFGRAACRARGPVACAAQQRARGAVGVGAGVVSLLRRGGAPTSGSLTCHLLQMASAFACGRT